MNKQNNIMMSGLNFDEEGKPLAIISSNLKKKPRKNQVVFISEDKITNAHRRLDIDTVKGMEDYKFYLMPSDIFRTIYVVGAAGSGKSYWVSTYIINFLKMKPLFKNRIYLFSGKNEDEAFDKIVDSKGNKIINRVKLDKDFIEGEFRLEDLRESLLIFDDYDSFYKNKKLNDKLSEIIIQSLNIGRSLQIHVICTCHLPCKGAFTSDILNTAQAIVWFRDMAPAKLNYLLENYTKLSRPQIKDFEKIFDGRSFVYCKTFPKVVISDKKIILVDDI